MQRAALLLAITAFGFSAIASAQTYPGTSDGRPAAAPYSQTAPTPRGGATDASVNPTTTVDLASVPDPVKTLTNLTVYARGVDIGHIARLSLDSSGKPDRVLIAFNSDSAPAWVSAYEVRYDAQKRQITTSMSAESLQNLGTMRIR